MKYTPDSKYKLVCPFCGHTEFYYHEYRLVKVQIEELYTYPSSDEDAEAEAHAVLGQDDPSEPGGEVPDDMYDRGAIKCQYCNHEMGIYTHGPTILLTHEEVKYI